MTFEEFYKDNTNFDLNEIRQQFSNHHKWLPKFVFRILTPDMRLSKEILDKWCEENCLGHYENGWDSYFELEQDAVKFKLAWL